MSTQSIVEVFTAEAVALELTATTKDGVLREMVDLAVTSKVLPRGRKEQVVDLLLERERRGSTAFGRGVAVPPAKVPGLQRPAGLVARSVEGLDFRAIDGEPVYALVMLVSPENRAEDHLATLRWLSTIARDPDFLSFIRQARVPEDVIDVFKERAP